MDKPKRYRLTTMVERATLVQLARLRVRWDMADAALVALGIQTLVDLAEITPEEIAIGMMTEGYLTEANAYLTKLKEKLNTK